MATALSMYNVFFIYPSLTELIIDNTKNDAVRVAKHLASTFMPATSEIQPFSANPEIRYEIKKITDTFELNKIKVFSNTGEIIFSSNPDDIGKFNK